MRRRALALVPLAALAVAATGCGSSDDSGGSGSGSSKKASDSSSNSGLSPVAAAAAKTVTQNSARMTFTGTGSIEGQQFTARGSGLIQFKPTPKTKLTTTLPIAGQSFSVDIVADGTTFFIKLPSSVSALAPGGKPWLKLDAGKALGSNSGLAQALSSGAQDPTQYLRFLQATGDATKVGTEQVDGVSTTHYRTTIDYAKLARSGPPKLRQIAKTAEKFTASNRIPADVWIDGDNLVRRQHIVVKTKSTGSVPGQTQNLTIDIPQYGVDTSSIQDPPASQVTDITSQAADALGQSGFGG